MGTVEIYAQDYKAKGAERAEHTENAVRGAGARRAPQLGEVTTILVELQYTHTQFRQGQQKLYHVQYSAVNHMTLYAKSSPTREN